MKESNEMAHDQFYDSLELASENQQLKKEALYDNQTFDEAFSVDAADDAEEYRDRIRAAKEQKDYYLVGKLFCDYADSYIDSLSDD